MASLKALHQVLIAMEVIGNPFSIGIIMSLHVLPKKND